MRKPCITGLLCLFFSYGIGQLSAPVARKFDPAPAGNTYALLIGIANYENRHIPNLIYF